MNLKTPLFDQLSSYPKKRRVSFAMPGHKGGKGLDIKFKKNIYKYDVTELEDTENLHYPNHSLMQSKKQLSEFYGAQESYFLVNGSTSGIHAMIAAACTSGGYIAVNRACHISVINACALLGVTPLFIEQDIIDTFSIPEGVDPAKLTELLDNHSEIQAVLITSPSYYGACSDIHTISKITGARGIPLLIDEAHGAHFAANDGIFPTTAVLQGADMVVQSAHKTLGALNQAAYLHFSSDLVDRNKLRSALTMVQTSSPSYPIVLSADLARAYLEKSGAAAWDKVCERCDDLRIKLEERTQVKFFSTMYNRKNHIEAVDPSRIVINFSAYNTTGFEVFDILRDEFNIDMEMADLFNVVGIATPFNSERDFVRLENAVANLVTEFKPSDSVPSFPTPPIPAMAMSPQSAFHSKGRFVGLDEAVGCVSRSTVVAYPPAVPIICTGELILPESVAYIEALKDIGAQICGLNENGYISIVEE